MKNALKLESERGEGKIRKRDDDDADDGGKKNEESL